MWSKEEKEQILRNLKKGDEKELIEKISNLKFETLSDIHIDVRDVVARLKADSDCVGCLAITNTLVKE